MTSLIEPTVRERSGKLGMILWHRELLLQVKELEYSVAYIHGLYHETHAELAGRLFTVMHICLFLFIYIIYSRSYIYCGQLAWVSSTGECTATSSTESSRFDFFPSCLTCQHHCEGL